MIGFFGLMEPSKFLTLGNFQTLFDSQAILLMLALALVISLTSGDFDLAVAGNFSVCLCVIGRLNVVDHIGYGWAILAALAVGLVVGLLHAVLIVSLGLSSFIVTLGSGTAFLGVAFAIENQAVQGVSPSYGSAMSASIGGLEVPFIIALALTIGLWYLYGYTPIGRQMYFVGASRDVARLAGLPVKRLRYMSLIASALVGSITAVVAAGYLGGADPNVASTYLLPVTASALLGATAIWPGRANPWGAYIATYFLVTGYTGLEEMGLSGWIQQVFYGGALVVAVAVAQFAASRRGTGRAEFGVT
jgi:ribose transport system permease protein